MIDSKYIYSAYYTQLVNKIETDIHSEYIYIQNELHLHCD